MEKNIDRRSFARTVALTVAGVGAAAVSKAMPVDEKDIASYTKGAVGNSMGTSAIPGELIFANTQIECNANRKTITLKAVNTGDRPVQIGSHYHFFESNSAMEFDREATFGMRLDIPAGTAVRFEPGEAKTVNLVSYGGAKKMYGFNDLVNGNPSVADAMKNVKAKKFKTTK